MLKIYGTIHLHKTINSAQDVRVRKINVNPCKHECCTLQRVILSNPTCWRENAPFPAHWRCFIPAPALWSAQREARTLQSLKAPWLHGQHCEGGPRPRKTCMPPTETPAPARCSPPSRCWLKCSPPSQRGRSKSCVLDNYYVTEVPFTTQAWKFGYSLTCEWAFFPTLCVSLVKVQLSHCPGSVILLISSSFFQSTRERPKGDIWACVKRP